MDRPSPSFAVAQLLQSRGVSVSPFTSDENRWQRREILRRFKTAETTALVTIRCLDEGIIMALAGTAYTTLFAGAAATIGSPLATGGSLLGREVPLHCVPQLCQALGLEDEHAFSAEQIVDAVLTGGRPMQVKGREALTLKRSMVNGTQRLELAGWTAARLDWYKAQGCFTEIIRYQTRLFVPTTGAAGILAQFGQ